MWNFAPHFSDEGDLPIFTFGIGGSLVHTRSLSSYECCSAPEYFASTAESGRYKDERNVR